MSCLALERNFAAMRFDAAFHDRQAQPTAGPITNIGGPVKRLE
jgi:hypothetical protein